MAETQMNFHGVTEEAWTALGGLRDTEDFGNFKVKSLDLKDGVSLRFFYRGNLDWRRQRPPKDYSGERGPMPEHRVFALLRKDR